MKKKRHGKNDFFSLAVNVRNVKDCDYIRKNEKQEEDSNNYYGIYQSYLLPIDRIKEDTKTQKKPLK